MPKATIDHDGYVCTGEYEICRASEIWPRASVDAVPKARSMEQSTHGQLRLRVA